MTDDGYESREPTKCGAWLTTTGCVGPDTEDGDEFVTGYESDS